MITISSNDDLNVSPDVQVATAAADISLELLLARSLFLGSGLVAASGAGLRVASALDSTLGNLVAETVSLVVFGDVVNGVGSAKNVTASNLRVESVGSVAVADRHLTIDVDTFSAASSTGSIFVTEDSGVTIQNVALTVTEFLTDGTTTTVTDTAQSDLSTGSNGDIVLVATLGDVILNDGTDSDGDAVVANGTGHILLDAAANLVVNADVSSDSGNITLKSGSDSLWPEGSQSRQDWAGRFTLIAGASVDTFANSRFINSTGDVVISAETVVNLGGVQSVGDVSIVSSTDSILRSGSTDFEREIIGSQLLLLSPNGSVGGSAAGEIIRADVDRISIISDGFFLLQTQGHYVLMRSVSTTKRWRQTVSFLTRHPSPLRMRSVPALRTASFVPLPLSQEI